MKSTSKLSYQFIFSSAMDTVRQEKVAIKKLVKPYQNETYAKHAFREIKIMKTVNHNNVRGSKQIMQRR